MRNGAYGAGIPIPEMAGFRATVRAAKTMLAARALVFIRVNPNQCLSYLRVTTQKRVATRWLTLINTFTQIITIT
jgi:hypothetical protein